MSFISRITAVWQSFRTGPAQAPAPEPELLRELAAARLERDERQREADQLRSQLQTQQKNEAERIREALKAHLNSFFSGLAAPLAQLNVQDFLLNNGSSISARDMLPLVRQIALAAQKAGLEPLAEIGQDIAFDPVYMQPLAAGIKINPGEMVQVKISGYRYRDQVIRKAFVERKN